MGAKEVLITIRNWLAGLRRAVLMNTLKSHALFALAAFVSVTLLLLLIESFGHFSGSVRTVLLAIWTVAAIAALGLGVVWPILKYTAFAPSDQKLANEYAKRMPGIRDHVLNALQLLEKVETAEKDGVSSDLILAAGRGVAEDLKPISPDSLPDKTSFRRSLRYVLVTSVSAIALLIIFGKPLISAGERVLNPGKDFLPCPEFVLHVAPGDVELVRGDSLKVIVTATGTLPKELTITRQEKGRNADSPLTVEGDEHGQYTVTWLGLTTTFDYWAYAENVTSKHYTANIKELPGVRFLSVTLTPPSYTGLPESVLEENVGDISAVVGTQAKLTLSATKPLASASLELFDKATPLKDEAPRETISLALDGSRGEVTFQILKSGFYRLALTDKENFSNRDAIYYRINARPDESPVVQLTQPSEDVEIAANVRVPIVADAADDFGFTKMQLRYYRTTPWDQPGDVTEDKYEKLAVDYKLTEPGRCKGEMLFDLTPLDLLPEDQVLIFVEVWDNDRISGPKRARSDMRVLRFPSMAEIFEQQEQVEEKRTITLEELLKESKDLREDVEKAVEEYKSNPEMNWERKQEIEQMMERQQQMSEILDKVAEAVERQQIQNEMRSMFSPEVLEKMEKIQELVQETISPEMREALRKLSEAMQQPSPEEMRKALDNFKKTQEQFNLTLDQVLNMLKQMQAEKKLDELARRLDELAKQQEQLNEKMDQNSPEKSKQNSEQQKKLSEEMKKIEQEMKQLAEQMKKDQLPQKEQMEQLSKEAQEEQLSEQMQQNSEQMQMCQNQSAKKKGKQVKRKMSDMAQQLQNMRQQMQSNQDMETLMEMEKARDKMLDLSMRQEQLWQESQETDPNSPQMSELAEEQENLRQAMKRIQEDMNELAKKSLAVTPKLQASIDETLKQMQAACNATQERDARTASHYRKQALSALNETLKQQNQACSQCQSQCNKPNSNSNCNKAGGMCQKQGQINQGTMSLMNNPGSLSQSQQASMQRLAGEQEGLAKSMEELAQEAQASKQSLGRLDDLAQEMKDVAEDLRQNRVTPQTIQRQEKIESRLLDYQRANREREFSPQRKSNTGIDVVRASPQKLPDRPGQEQLREDLLRALDTQYSADYEELIRKYFDALSKWQ